MPVIELPITNGFYKSRSLPISNQECVNAYVHINKTGLSSECLYGTPGISQVATTGVDMQKNRGSHVMDDVPYFVNGTTLYSLTRSIDALGRESFAVTSKGTIEGLERVSMADNGTQLLILQPGGKGYIYNRVADTLAEITDLDFRANGDPQYVVFINGYFLLTTDEKKFIISALNDGTSYSALDFGSAEVDPDGIVAPVVLNNQVYICGTETIEPFYDNSANTGASFPFTRIDGGVISVGVFAAFSLVKVAGTAFFIGGSVNESPSIYALTGGSISIISDDGINFVLEQLSEDELSGVFGWTYSENGARFVGFTLPTTTIVYDITSQRWHERKSRITDGANITETRWRPNSLVKAYSRILVGDFEDGRIGQVKLDIYDEYGEDIATRFSTVPFSNRGERILVPRIELTVESGVGNEAVTDPAVWMNRSLDGKTWSDNFVRKIGKIGEYTKRVIWRRVGRAARFEVFRFSMSDRVKKVFVKLEADIL